MYPNLGVVRVGDHQSFVMADIPGVIEGAAEGAGLGIKFLKHLQRTRLLLHLVDIEDPAVESIGESVSTLTQELGRFSQDLLTKPRWLVLNKMDLLSSEDQAEFIEAIRQHFTEFEHVHFISAIGGQGVDALMTAIMTHLDAV